jgi:hypothetical protein
MIDTAKLQKEILREVDWVEEDCLCSIKNPIAQSRDAFGRRIGVECGRLVLDKTVAVTFFPTTDHHVINNEALITITSKRWPRCMQGLREAILVQGRLAWEIL